MRDECLRTDSIPACVRSVTVSSSRYNIILAVVAAVVFIVFQFALHDAVIALAIVVVVVVCCETDCLCCAWFVVAPHASTNMTAVCC